MLTSKFFNFPIRLICLRRFSSSHVYRDMGVKRSLSIIILLSLIVDKAASAEGDGVLGCGGFVKSDVEINFSLVEVIIYW